MKTIMVTGSRNWRDERTIMEALRDGGKYGEKPSLIVGDADGADTIAAGLALSAGWPVRVYPANWERHGRRAGILRNLEMLDQNPELVLAFWDGLSRGTQHCWQEAVARRIPTNVYVRRP